MLDFQSWAIGKGYLQNALTQEQLWDPQFINNANQALQ
jgi:hypothetical protein